MSKAKRVVVASGLCLLVIGACVYVTRAGEPAEVKPDLSADSLRFSAVRDELPAVTWNADDMKLEKRILVAQAGAAGSAPKISVQATEEGVGVGVSQEFSTWSDVTAVFRPSRWRSPFREGGSLSWLNHRAWANAPGRTGKVFLGEAIVAGAMYVIIDYNRHHGDDDVQPVIAPAPAASGKSSSSGSSSGSSSSGSSTSSSGSSTSSSGSSTSSSSGSSTSSSSGSSTSSSSSGELPF